MISLPPHPIERCPDLSVQEDPLLPITLLALQAGHLSLSHGSHERQEAYKDTESLKHIIKLNGPSGVLLVQEEQSGHY